VTTRDLINEFVDLENEKEWADEEDKANIETSLVEIRTKLSKKADNLDKYLVEVKRQEGLIKAEIDTLMDEVKRLRSRKKAVERTEEYFNKVLLPMIVKTLGEDNVFRTDTTKYTLYQTYGPVEVTDEDLVPDQYKRVKLEIDKKGAKQAIIEAKESGLGIAGLDINKVDRIRRS
jgi:hypothetical protein